MMINGNCEMQITHSKYSVNFRTGWQREGMSRDVWSHVLPWECNL